MQLLGSHAAATARGRSPHLVSFWLCSAALPLCDFFGGRAIDRAEFRQRLDLGSYPGAAAIVFTVGREKIGYSTGYARHDYLTQAADAAGTVCFHFIGVRLLPSGVWSTFSRRYATATPPAR